LEQITEIKEYSLLDAADKILEAILKNELSEFFLWFIVAYFVVAILSINSKDPKFRQLADHAPTTLTTLGILGTFTGIFLGLIDFNFDTPTRSIPVLLTGLKIAFGTSIVGIFSAILFKILRPFCSKHETSEDVDAREILNKLNELNETNQKGFENLRKTLSEDTDTSIVGQLQRLRGNISDLEKTNEKGFEQQINEFKSFADKMSEAFSKAIIEELQSVIREFNEKISEQFGENFKKLNEAVGRLVTWQENYRNQMDELKNSLDNSIKSIEQSQTSLMKIEESAASIPTHVDRLSEIYGRIQTQADEIESTLSAFAEIKEKATNAFPEIQENLNNYTTNLTKTTKEQIELITTSIESLTGNVSDSLTKHQEAQQQMLDGLKTTAEQQTAAVTESIKGLKNNVSDSLTKQQEAQQQILDGLKKNTEEQTTLVTESIKGLKNNVSDSLTEQQEAQQQMLDGLKKNTEEQTTLVTESINDLKNNVSDSLTEQQEAQQQMLDGLQSSFNEVISNANASMEDAITQLDEAIQNEIGTVVLTMAENLSGITEKFVSDYTPLLESTRRIVELAERADDEG